MAFAYVGSDSLSMNTVNAISGPERINFTTTSDGNSLSVTLIKPVEMVKKVPAVIFLVGSGEYSTISSYTNFIDHFLVEPLVDEGVVIVLFDKRGAGKSEGLWYETTFEQRAFDAHTVAKSLEQFDFIDTNEIYLVGHSQGGWIVQIALSLYSNTFKAGISMAGPTFGVRRQIINDYMSSNICNRNMEAEKALKRAESKVKRDLFLVSVFGRRGNYRQLKLIKDFEPDTHISLIQNPILLLFAENDRLVSHEWSIQSLNAIFQDNVPANFEYYVAEGEDHSFRTAPFCNNDYMGGHEYSVNTRKMLTTWLKAHMN